MKSVQKWNKLPSSIRTFNSKTCFKNVLTESLLDQHKKVLVNRQIGAFKSYFYLWKRTATIYISKLPQDYYINNNAD